LVTNSGEHATAALRELDRALQASIAELTAARARVETVLAARSSGKAWRDIVSSEERPLVVESVTSVLDQLSAVGSRFRRAQAQALHREGLSMERVAALFGVTRQRVSALLRDRESPEPVREAG
jgi:predicted XRE-type DNA-binding protein